MTSPLLTREQVKAHLDFAIHEPYNPAWGGELLAHDAALRARVEELEQEIEGLKDTLESWELGSRGFP